MKRLRSLLPSLMLLGCCSAASAQYYQLANQIPQLIQPALLGGLNYKGFVEAGYTAGIGPRKANFAEISTTQGFRYSSWFFMGVGIAFQYVNTERSDNYNPWQYRGYADGHSSSRGACMMPLYSDFRFNIGNGMTSTSFFIDLRLGASFLLGNDYLEIGDGFLTSNEAFYFRPSIGLRIPLNQSGSQALNVGVNYQLLTQDYWYRYSNDVTLSSFGMSVGFEW